MRTWDHWHENHREWQPIDIEDYEAIGGLRTALSLHAEEAFEEAGDERAQTVVERMFKALTDTFADPRGTRRPTSVAELASVCGVDQAEVIRIVDIFRRQGRSFLTPPAEVPLNARSIVDHLAREPDAGLGAADRLGGRRAAVRRHLRARRPGRDMVERRIGRPVAESRTGAGPAVAAGVTSDGGMGAALSRALRGSDELPRPQRARAAADRGRA